MMIESFLYVPIGVVWLWSTIKRHKRLAVQIFPLLVYCVLVVFISVLVFRHAYHPTVWIMLIVISFVRPTYINSNVIKYNYILMFICLLFVMIITGAVELLRGVNQAAYWYLKGILTGQMMVFLMLGLVADYLESTG